MVLFAGAGFSLVVAVLRSICLTPAAQVRAKVLYIRADNADGGRGNIAIVSIAESGNDRYSPPTPMTGRMSGSMAAAHGARTKWPDGVWYAAMRSPPRGGGLSAVASHDTPLSASMEVIFR